MHDNFTRLASRHGGPGERSEDQVLQVAGPVSQPEVAAGLNPYTPFPTNIGATLGFDPGPPSPTGAGVLCQPMSGKSHILDDYRIRGAMTGRWSSSKPNLAFSKTQRITHVALTKQGGRWRMGAGESKPWELDPRPFSSRAAALKYCRRLWPSARVELSAGGLKVRIARWSSAAAIAIALRLPENRKPKSALSGNHGIAIVRVDFADVERRLAAVFGLARIP